VAEYGVNINLRVKGQSGLDRLNNKVKELTKSVDNIRQIDIMNPRNTGGKAGQGARNELKKYRQDMEDIVKSVNKAKGAFGETAAQQMAVSDALEEYTNNVKIGTKEHKNALAATNKQNAAIGRETISINKNTDAQIKNNKAQAQGNRLDKFNNKGTGAALKSGLISGAFPLLFGQGPLGGAAGFAGGFLGTKMGGQMGGFAGGLVATAVLQQITTATEKIKELGKALSVENLNLDPIIRAVGGVGTSTEKYLKLIEQVEGKQAAYNAAVDKMRSIVGDKGVRDIQEFTKRMQDLTNALSTFFTRLGAGFASIFNKLANSPLGKAASATNLKLDRLARAENNTNPLMVALRGKRDALIGSGLSSSQKTKVKNSPEFLELQNRIAGLQHFLDLQEKITEEENIQKLTTDSILKNVKEENLFLQQSMLMGSEQAQIEAKIRDLKEQRKLIGEKLSDDDEKALRDQLKLNNALTKANELYTQIGATIETGIVDAIEGAINGTKTLGEVARSVFTQIQRSLIQYGVNAFLGGLPGIGGFFRAEGGPVSKGRSYIVGERGPEMFTPASSGNITPNHELGGSTNVVVNVDASGSSVEGDEQRGRELGRLISVAVQSELVQQKRPGGLLA
jgi:hypothetical protein